MEKTKYTIELTDRQVRVYRDALEFYSRFLAGQVTHLPPILIFGPDYYKVRQQAEKYLFDFKKLVFPKLYMHESYGIGWSDDKIEQERQIAYEMYREVYVQQTKETGAQDVYSSSTLKYSDQSLPIVKLKKD